MIIGTASFRKKKKKPLSTGSWKIKFYKDEEGRKRVRSICTDKYGHEKGIYGKKGQLLVT